VYKRPGGGGGGAPAPVPVTTVPVATPVSTFIPTPVTSSGFGAAAPRTTQDVVAPVAHIAAEVVTAGKASMLAFTVTDKSTIKNATATITKNGKVVATVTAGLVHVGGSAYTLKWKAPASLKGKLTVCVVATDKSGNKSKSSCAALTVR
jgi:hypothetical protein